MHHPLSTLFFHYFDIWPPLGYGLLFLGTVIEGEGVIFLAGFLAHQGFLYIGDAALALVAGALLGDAMWYWIGGHDNFLSRWARKWSEKIAKPFDDHLLSRPFRTIFISKFTYNLHHAIMFRAGAIKLPLRELLKDDVVVTIVWALVVGALGYGFSAGFVLARHYLRFAEIGLLLAFIIFISLWHFISAGSKKKL